ncbi:MAG: hypothetical protein GEEBNDBF_02216 [bacterium]|nr:hypothetical protein [bacterium]
MHRHRPGNTKTLVIVLLLCFMGVIGLAVVGAAVMVVRQPALIGTLMARVTGKAMDDRLDATAPPVQTELPDMTEPESQATQSDEQEETPAPDKPVVTEEAVSADDAVPTEEAAPESPATEEVVPSAETPQEPAPAPETKPEVKPTEKPAAKPGADKPAATPEKKPTNPGASLASGPRKFYIHIGKCLGSKEARDLQRDLNGRWGDFGIKQDAEKGLNFTFWKMGPQEGKDPKSFNPEDFCYQIRTGAITQKQAKHLQEKLKSLGHTAGIGQEA